MESNSLVVCQPNKPVDCTGCGACCVHMGYPAFNVNEEHWQQLPIDLRRELDVFIEAYVPPGVGELDPPCFWLDVDTRQCKHHEHRPQVCRDFEIGSSECIDWRKHYSSWLLEQ